jgi:hypothetical protein
MNSGEGLTHGLIWVEGGQVRVKNPGPGGKPATILPCPNVEIMASGRKIASEEPVGETTPLQIHFPEKQPTVAYVVKIAHGGLEASVTLQTRDGSKYALKDVPPAETLVLQYSTSPVPAAPSVESLLEAVKQKGVVLGIDTQACNDACAHPPAGPFVVARGEPFIPGKDGEIQFLVPMERIVDLPPDELQIDFRETVKRPDVKAGQVIAVKRDPVPGTPGKSVTGATLPPPRPRDPHFRPGKGVEIKQDQPGLQSAVATISGCPMFAEGSGVTSVEPVFTYKGDIDLSSGNMRSSGGLNIIGQVTEGMKVECEGNQDISGTVTGAALKAWGSIKVRGNIFQSTVSAGKDSTWTRTMDSLLRDVEEAIEGIVTVEAEVKEVMERQASGAEISPADEQFLDQDMHLERFRTLVVSLSALYKENLKLFPKEIADEIRVSRESLSAHGIGIFEKTHMIAGQLANPRLWVSQELLKGKSDVAFPYAQSSTIEASRDIIVTGQGVYYCTMIAGRVIKVSGSPGLVRGGEARARELVQVNAAGGQGAAPTLLAVSSEGKILAQTIYPNTIISVGRRSFRTENTIEAVKASMQGGRLVIVTSTGSMEIQ